MNLLPNPAELSGYADDALAEALKARHPAAAVVAWERFRPLVMRILRRRAAGSDLADDVAQEVFTYFFSGVPKLRDPRSLRAFVVTLSHRILTNELRRRQRRTRFHVHTDAQQLNLIGDRADAFMRHASWRLHGLLMRLRERDRHVLLMCLVERRRAEEVAALMGLSVPTIRRALARARRRLAMWSEMDPFLCEFGGLSTYHGGGA